MEFWASSESYIKASENLDATWRLVEPYLNHVFGNSSLNDLKIKLRYVPIVMSPESLANYPERSRARIKQNIYLCAPQLDYQTFVDGTLSDQLDEYLRGIALSSPFLKKFGATPEQVREFDLIIATARDAILNQIISPPA
jgi:hypothetical protein